MTDRDDPRNGRAPPAFFFPFFLALASLSTLTCGGTPEEEAPVARGQRLYGETCTLCHGSAGEGYRADEAPRLASQELLSHASDEFLRRAIVDGRPGSTMSAWGREWGGPLTDTDADAIVAYLRTWQTVPAVPLDPQPIAGDAARGVTVYDAECKVCHGERGRDGRYLQLENPVFLASASDAYIRAAVERGRPDTPMPSFASRLPKAAMDDVVSLLRSWQRPVDGPESLPPGPGALVGVVLNPGGAEPAFDASARFVPADAIKAALDQGSSFVIADARPPADYAGGHVAGAISVPFYRVEAFLPEIPKDRFVITYCSCPHAESGEAARVFRSNGYPRVAVLDEGFAVWRSRGYPVRSGPAP